jgi:hypothetical protein
MTQRTVTQAVNIPVFNYDAFWFTAKNIGGVAASAKSSTPFPAEWYAK